MLKTEYTIPAPVKMTLALVTDLHEHDPEPVLAILRETRPDVITVAGDTLERHYFGENIDRGDESFSSRLICAIIHLIDRVNGHKRIQNHEISTENSYHFLREAVNIAPVVMSLGNHELYLTDEDRQLINSSGIIFLEDAACKMGNVLFGGLSSKQMTGKIDHAFLKEYSENADYKILLCHHPEYYPEIASYPVNLILSGHCHGGQIRLLGRGIFAPGQGVLPKYHHGVYDDRLVVCAGCSNTSSIPRIGNPPEVVILKLG